MDTDNLDAKRAMDELTSQCYTSFTRQGGNVYPESKTEQALHAEIAELKAQVEKQIAYRIECIEDWRNTCDGFEAQLAEARSLLREVMVWLEEDAYMTEVSTGRTICNSCGEYAPTRKMVSHHSGCWWDDVFRRFNSALKGAK